MTMLPVPEIDTSEVQTFVTQATEMLASAEDFEIRTPDQYEAAGLLLRRIKKEAGDTDKHRKSLTRPIDEYKQSVMDQFSPVTRMYDDAEMVLKKAMLSFQREEERLRAEEEARQRDIAAREQKRLEDRAEKAKAKGDDSRAAVLEERAETAPTPRVQSRVPRAPGTSTRTVWKAQVTDFPALIQAVADGKAPITLIEPNMKVLNQQAKSLKGGFDYPGVEATSEQTMAVSSN